MKQLNDIGTTLIMFRNLGKTTAEQKQKRIPRKGANKYRDTEAKVLVT
jgi:hypothetical protein